MADVTEFFLNGVSPTATGTAYSTVLNTNDRNSFAVEVRLPTTTGSGADTLDMYLESSDESTFTNAYKIRTESLWNPTVADTTAPAASFTQIVGATTLPAATNTATTLRQKWLLKDTNYPRYLRVRYVIATTATSFTNINVMLLSNRKV